MKLGIVGLQGVGKTTLFNSLAGGRSTVAVPDTRLERLAELYHPKKVTYAQIEFVDTAGGRLQDAVRQADALVHVVRCFDEPDPERDIAEMNVELCLADLDLVQRRVDKVKKLLKGDKKFAPELAFFENLAAHLDGGNPARTFPIEDSLQAEWLASAPLLSAKPVLYAANVAETPDTDAAGIVAKIAQAEGAEALQFCAPLEWEISQLPPEDQGPFLADLGLAEPGLHRLIQASYRLLGLMSFLTAGEPEVRAWTIPKGLKAPMAAGKIHSDLQRGFIRAECVHFDDLMRAGSMAAAKEQNLVRSEGKEYVMKDGDVVLFRFNV
jgi:GTP-binding protein YchF